VRPGLMGPKATMASHRSAKLSASVLPTAEHGVRPYHGMRRN
jgi:hypothetical protein